MALVRDGGADPFSGALYVFRSKRADRIKAVWWDGSGICLFAKTLEETKFCWPKIAPTYASGDGPRLGRFWRKADRAQAA
jgi:transposase